MTKTSASEEAVDGDFTIIDLLVILAEAWKMLLLVPLLAGLAASLKLREPPPVFASTVLVSANSYTRDIFKSNDLFQAGIVRPVLRKEIESRNLTATASLGSISIRKQADDLFRVTGNDEESHKTENVLISILSQIGEISGPEEAGKTILNTERSNYFGDGASDYDASNLEFVVTKVERQ